MIIIGDENKKPDPAGKPASGIPHMNILYVIIAVAVIVLAVIFIAKFGFGTDLISPSSGEMAVVKKGGTPLQQVVQTPNVRPTFTLKPLSCASNQTACGRICTDTAADPENCGACGAACPSYPNMTRRCYAGSYVPPYCEKFYADCNKNPADGCEVSLSIDENNCGRCGIVCSSGQVCSLFQCGPGLSGPGNGTAHPEAGGVNTQF